LLAEVLWKLGGYMERMDGGKTTATAYN